MPTLCWYGYTNNMCTGSNCLFGRMGNQPNFIKHGQTRTEQVDVNKHVQTRTDRLGTLQTTNMRVCVCVCLSMLDWRAMAFLVSHVLCADTSPLWCHRCLVDVVGGFAEPSCPWLCTSHGSLWCLQTEVFLSFVCKSRHTVIFHLLPLSLTHTESGVCLCHLFVWNQLPDMNSHLCLISVLWWYRECKLMRIQTDSWCAGKQTFQSTSSERGWVPGARVIYTRHCMIFICRCIGGVGSCCRWEHSPVTVIN